MRVLLTLLASMQLWSVANAAGTNARKAQCVDGVFQFITSDGKRVEIFRYANPDGSFIEKTTEKPPEDGYSRRERIHIDCHVSARENSAIINKATMIVSHSPDLPGEEGLVSMQTKLQYWSSPKGFDWERALPPNTEVYGLLISSDGSTTAVLPGRPEGLGATTLTILRRDGSVAMELPQGATSCRIETLDVISPDGRYTFAQCRRKGEIFPTSIGIDIVNHKLATPASHLIIGQNDISGELRINRGHEHSVTAGKIERQSVQVGPAIEDLDWQPWE